MHVYVCVPMHVYVYVYVCMRVYAGVQRQGQTLTTTINHNPQSVSQNGCRSVLKPWKAH